MKVTINDKEVTLSTLDGVRVWKEVGTMNVVCVADGSVKPVFECTEESMALGRILFSARKKAGLTMDQVVSISGISKPSLNGYEKGRIYPNFESLCRLTYILGIDMMEVMKAYLPEQ